MAWTIEWDERALRDAEKLPKDIQRRIFRFLEERIADDPRRTGRALTGPLAGLWRYRIGDYRLVCRIEDKQLTVLIVAVGHRKEIYD